MPRRTLTTARRFRLVPSLVLIAGTLASAPLAALDFAATSVRLTTVGGGGTVVESPTVGQQVYLQLNYTVSGTAGIDLASDLRLDGNVRCSGSFQVYTGGWYIWCTAPWTATAGSHTITGVLDPAGQIGESNEANNQVSATFMVASPAAWPMFRHDLQHTGRSPYNGPAVPTKKWAFQTGSLVRSSPAIGGDGTVYVGSEDGKLYAIRADGTETWEFQTGNAIHSSPAIGADGTVYVGSEDGRLYAIRADGTERWEFQAGELIDSSPAIAADGTLYVGVYVGSGDNRLLAIRADGSKKWEFQTGGYVNSSPTVGADGTIYVGSGDNKLSAIRADGTKKWEFQTRDPVFSSPAIGADGTVYFGSLDNKLHAIRPDGIKKWELQAGSPVFSIFSSPAIAIDGTLYVASEDSKLYAIRTDGTKKWEFSTGSSLDSSPAIGADGTVYLGSLDSKLYAIRADGTKKWEFLTGDEVSSSPAIGADGTVYVGSHDGKLYAIGAGAGSITVAGSSTGAVNQNLTFTASATGCTPRTAWVWNPGGGTMTGTRATRNIRWSTSGTKTISVTNAGCPGVTGLKTVTIQNSQFALTVRKAGPAATSGRVTSSPAGIDCGTGAGCASNFTAGSTVTLTATNATGGTVSWSSTCRGGQVTMSAAKTCTVTFNDGGPTRDLTVNKTGSGAGTVTITSATVSTCGPACPSLTVHLPLGSAVNLSATAQSGSSFDGWSDPACASRFTLSSNRTCTARFTTQTPQVQLSVTKTGDGTVTSAPAGINCGSTCSASFNQGSTVTLTATWNNQTDALTWGGACSGSGASVQVVMNTAKTCTATFVKRTYRLTLTVEGPGSVNGSGVNCSGSSCAYDFPAGTQLTLTANPSTIYRFLGWAGDCNPGSPQNPTASLTMNANKGCTARFGV